MRIVGRLSDLHRRGVRTGERRFGDDGQPWSLRRNAAWLAGGIESREPFLQVSPAAAGSVLAWELRLLREGGYMRLGPLWLPRQWLVDEGAYRRAVRGVFVGLAQEPWPAGAVSPEYGPKAAAELEPMLDLWPHVLAVPTASRLSPTDLIALRAWPVHALGVVHGACWADGALRHPFEFFCHDLDHARFKVREDLLARGVTIPDAYVGGSTFDERHGRHRTILAAAARHVDGDGWRSAPVRARFVDGLQTAIAALADEPARAAARWLLFELVHEKSLPLHPGVLAAALQDDAHVNKLVAKCARRFHGDHTPTPEVVQWLGAARGWLAARFAERA